MTACARCKAEKPEASMVKMVGRHPAMSGTDKLPKMDRLEVLVCGPCSIEITEGKFKNMSMGCRIPEED